MDPAGPKTISAGKILTQHGSGLDEDYLRRGNPGQACPGLDEDCEPDGVDEPRDFERLPAIVNAGEEDAPLLSDLSESGFPDEDAWLDQPFCGGQGRDTSCSSSVRQKLLEDPFDYAAEDALIEQWKKALASLESVEWKTMPGYGAAYSGPGGRARTKETFEE